MDNNSCRQAMEASLKKLEIDLKRTDFFITHCHIDHFGLLTSLVRQGSIIYINRREAIRFTGWDQAISCRTGWRSLRPVVFLRTRLKTSFHRKAPGPIGPRILYILVSGRWRHLKHGWLSFQMCWNPRSHQWPYVLIRASIEGLYGRRSLLNEITPGIHGFTHENPLKDYLSSLDKVAALDVRLVLPGHRSAFENCKERMKFEKPTMKKGPWGHLDMEGESERCLWCGITDDMGCYYDSWRVFPIQQRFLPRERLSPIWGFLKERSHSRTNKGQKNSVFFQMTCEILDTDNQCFSPE
jgi:hypothetical protein